LSEYNDFRKEHLRTYKVGLKVPERLVKRQNQLLIKREILHFLRNSYYDEGTLFSKKLKHASQSTFLKYKRAFKKYQNLSLKEITEQLKINKSCLISLQRNNPLLSQKQQNLMKEMKRQAIMLYLFIAYKTGANYLSWDAIGGISTRGKSGALAQAITYLPKQKAQFEICKQWAEDLKTQELLPSYKDIIPVSSFTSQICAHCFQKTGEFKKTLVKGLAYDIFQCKQCNNSSNRHSNAAQVSALLVEQIIHTQHSITPSPLTMG